MIIEVIPHGAIPYKCSHCESMYLWTPSCTDGECILRSGSPECEKSDCHYYKPDIDEARCPFCKNQYDQERISPFKYKIARAFKGRQVLREQPEEEN